MHLHIENTKFPNTWRLWDDDKLLCQGGWEYCVNQKERYEFCEGKPECTRCGHDLMSHMHSSSLVLRSFGSYGACDYSAGVMDWGCSCIGYSDLTEFQLSVKEACDKS